MANQKQFFTGQTDIALSPLGREQAARTAEYLVQKERIDAVYASDLSRAFETAEAVAQRIKLPVHPHRGLREIFAGAWEQMPFATLNENPSDAWRIWREDIGHAVCPGGESVADMQRRVIAAFREIAHLEEGHTVVIGTHATPIRALECYSQNRPLGEMKDIPWVPNASVTTAILDGDTITLTEIGANAHLADLITTLPQNV